MFGTNIKKYCPVCKKDIGFNISTSFSVDGKEYFTHCFCPICHTDLSVEDRKALKLAKEEGKDIGVCMS